MQSNVSVFGFLMQLLNISINNLSIYLNLERSTVSKWKSGIRNFSPSSSYFDWVIEYFIAENQKSGLNALEKLYLQLFPSEDTTDPKYLYLCTKRFLSQSDLPISFKAVQDKKDFTYSTEITVFKGIEGRFLAFETILEMLKQKKTPSKIYICENSNLLLFDSTSFYINRYIKLLKSFLDLGHDITIIYSMSNSNAIFDFKEYDQLVFYPNFNEFFCFTQNKLLKGNSYCVVKDLVCMYGTGSSEEKSKLYSALYYDYHSLYHYEQSFNSILKQTRPMFPKHTQYTQNEFFAMVLKDHFLSESICLYSDNINILTMDKVMLENIIQNNKLNVLQKNKIDQSVKTFDFFTANTHNNITHIYNIENLENYVLQGTPLLYLSGSISLNISKEIRVKHIENIVELLKKHSNFNVTLIHSAASKSSINAVSICKNNLWYYTFNYNLSKCRFNKDPQIANLIYTTLTNISQNTSFELNSKESVIKRLEKIASL